MRFTAVDLTCIMIVLLSLVVCGVTWWSGPQNYLVETLGPDGRRYLVRKIDDHAQSAAALARMNRRIQQFLAKLRVGVDPEHEALVARMVARYRPDSLSENVAHSDHTAYTVDKGRRIVFCLRTRDARDALYDDNKLFYVALHELAHVASEKVDPHHGPEFDAAFGYIYRKAVQFGLLDPIREPWNYCGEPVRPLTL